LRNQGKSTTADYNECPDNPYTPLYY